MGNLLFSPNGRIGAAEFQRGAIMLIGLAAIIKLSALVSYSLSNILNVAALVMLWCWVVLWIKRFHDAGKSGWMSLVPIAAFLVTTMVVGVMLSPMMMGDMSAEMADMAEDAVGEQDLASMFSAMGKMGAGAARKMAIPGAILGVIVSGAIAYIGNMLIKHDGVENQYGPVD